MQLAVLLRGKLRGMGLEVPCEVMATRTAGGNSGKTVYSGIRLIDAPAYPPDGDYVIALDAITVGVRRRKGEWLMGSELLAEHRISGGAQKKRLIA